MPDKTKSLDPVQPVRIDRFILLERIGAGGMGEIYSAYDDRLDRKVAIKLVRTGLDRAARAEKRLLREARTLARLSHPNVVQVYEAGVVAGRVFIAMEFIRGKNLRQWLDEQKGLPRRVLQRAILRHFTAAGRGLEAAHKAGLTHRDFKPENVLVGDDGRVRVVDFGLARALAAPPLESGPGETAATAMFEASTIDFNRQFSGEKESAPGRAQQAQQSITGLADGTLSPIHSERTCDTAEMVHPSASDRDGAKVDLRPEIPKLSKAALALTTPGTLVGTPRYMAPEQLHVLPADSRSDQFSFCVALYEALYGQRPFAGDNFADLMHSVESGQIRPPPRGADVPAPVRKALWRGLSTERAERFPSMGELLAAIEEGPKRRSQRRMGALFSVAVLVVAGLFSLWSPARSPGVCASAGSELDEVWHPARKAALGTAFASTGFPDAATAWDKVDSLIDQYSDAWRSAAIDACQATLVRQTQSPDLLDRSMACLERGRGQLVALLDGLARADAQAVARSAEAAEKLPDVAICRNIDLLLTGPELPANTHVARAITTIRQSLDQAKMHKLLGRYREALRIGEDQRAAAEAIEYPPVQAETYHRIANALLHDRSAENEKRAEELLLRAVFLAESNRHDQLAVELWFNLVELARSDPANSERGQSWLERAEIAIHRIGNPAPERAWLLRQKGLLHHRDGRTREAIELLRRAVALAESNPSESHKLTWYLHALARAERKFGQTQQAEQHFERALAVADQYLGPQHPQAASVRSEFALLLVELGRIERARALLDQARATWVELQGPLHLEVGKIHRSLANVERQIGNLDRARHHVAESVRVYDHLFGPRHLGRASLYFELGALDYERRDFASALDAYQQALQIRERRMGENHVAVGLMHVNIAEALIRLSRYEQALAAVQKGRRILAAGQLRAPVIEPWTLSVLGQALLGQGRMASAISRLEDSVAQFDAISNHPGERAAALWALARALRARGAWPDKRTRNLAERARALYESRGQVGEFERQAITRWLGEDTTTEFNNQRARKTNARIEQ
ncbi:MAG: serine/threonine-protein kinase [Proteobacteria bacterium]|nr:serine/threonine-protein kinase [Pseudomonadota bacterium]